MPQKRCRPKKKIDGQSKIYFGTIIAANQNFLDAVGYSLEEIRGKHHSSFVEPAHRDSADYRAFWAKLGRGEFESGQYLRIGKGGREIWLEASYNPIFDMRNRPLKVVKHAIDITNQKNENRLILGEATRVIAGIAAGDLTVAMQGQFEGDFAKLSDAVNECAARLKSVVNEIRSAMAAKEIKGLIQDSVLKVEEGSKLVNESGATLGEIVISVKKVNDIISEIASASEEQSTGIKQVNQAVMQIDETVQQNAALVEQAAAAAESLCEQSEILNNLMDQFNTGDQRQSPAVIKSAAPLKRPTPSAARAPVKAAKKSLPNLSPPRLKAVGSSDSWQEF